MTPQLQKKIDFAIHLLQAFDNPDQPVEIAYSGGKDSDVILQLAKESGINFRAIYKNTTIDPPGTVRHAEQMGAEVFRPEKNFFQLVAERGYPSIQRRFCCQILKEYKVLDKCVMGVRKAESAKRANRYQEPTECRFYGSKKEHVEAIYPILEWTNEDVEEFIKDRGIKCAPVYYDEQGNFHVERRLGCLGCPQAYYKNRIEVFKQYPRLVRAYIRAGRKYMLTHPDSVISKTYPDEYAYFYRNVFCNSQEDYNRVADGLFGKPDFKGFLEKTFNITL